ncbi:hypothetical protein SOVF_182870, partial [Spinacia oleracea]
MEPVPEVVNELEIPAGQQAQADALPVDNTCILPEEPTFKGRRSPVWVQYLRLDPSETKDGKERALCKHCKTTSFISSTHYGTSNMRKHIEKCPQYLAYMQCSKTDGKELTESNDEVLKQMAIEMKIKFDKYWFNSEEDDYGMLFAFAVVLDPRCKLSVLMFCYESLYGKAVAELKISDITRKLEMFCKEYAPEASILQEATTTNTPSQNHKRKFDYFATYDNNQVVPSYVGNSQLQAYLGDAKLDRTSNLDILNFWKENEY